jgi:hypothetical protein
MEGIQVLSQSEVYNAGDGGFIGVAIFVVFFIVSIGWFFLTLSEKEYGKSIAAFFAILLTGFFVTIGIIASNKTHVEYKITISDQVKINEFNQKYNVISQEGKIYTITEKERKD